MKKIVSLLSFIFGLCFFTTALAASVPGQTFPANDTDPNDYLPPAGCLHHQIPGSDSLGTHTLAFDNEGVVDPEGSYIFTVTVGIVADNEYTQVLSWTSNFPMFAVIVNGGDQFNLYEYNNAFREDSNLLSPIDESGLPANVNHVSILMCPEALSTDLSLPLQIGRLSTILIVNTIFQVISTILLCILTLLTFLLLFGSTFNLFATFICKSCKKPQLPDKDQCDKKKDKDCHKRPPDCNKKPTDCHKKPADCHKKEEKICHHKPIDCDYKKDKNCKQKPTDCDQKNKFPYCQDFHDFF